MLVESCKGKRRKGDPVSFCKNRGPCLWLVVSAGLINILFWQQLYWFFYWGLLMILALGFLSVSILRSNKEVAELPNREAVMKDIQYFTNVWDWQVDTDVLAEPWSLATIVLKSLWALAWITDRELLIFSSCAVLVPLFQCTKKRMARKGFCWCFKSNRNHVLEGK